MPPTRGTFPTSYILFSDSFEVPLDLANATCKASTSKAGYGCVNAIHSDMAKDWATSQPFAGDRSSWIEVLLSDTRAYHITRSLLLNRQYGGDYGKAMHQSIREKTRTIPLFF